MYNYRNKCNSYSQNNKCKSCSGSCNSDARYNQCDTCMPSLYTYVDFTDKPKKEYKKNCQCQKPIKQKCNNCSNENHIIQSPCSQYECDKQSIIIDKQVNCSPCNRRETTNLIGQIDGNDKSEIKVFTVHNSSTVYIKKLKLQTFNNNTESEIKILIDGKIFKVFNLQSNMNKYELAINKMLMNPKIEIYYNLAKGSSAKLYLTI